MPPVVIKIGGSITFPGKPDVELIKKMANQLAELEKPAIVIGAGKILRDSYLSTLRGSGLDRDFLDNVGIMVSRINARVVARFLATGQFAETLDEAKMAFAAGKIPVMGGLKPGQSTDAVAAQLAKALGAATLLVLTDVDGIYDKDPNKHGDAKKFDRMSFAQLESLCSGLSAEPGNHPVFDAVAAAIVSQGKIRTIIGNGRKHSLRELLSGKNATVVE